MKKIAIVWLILLIPLFININCGILGRKKKGWQPVVPPKISFVHTVKWPEETLKIIAKWYTGDSKNWNLLADANPIINPDRLFAGNDIFIPKELLKTRKILPKEFIIAIYRKANEKKKKQTKNHKKPKQKKKKTVSKPPPPPKLEEEFELFGPK